jgi:hypothetical protein
VFSGIPQTPLNSKGGREAERKKKRKEKRKK